MKRVGCLVVALALLLIVLFPTSLATNEGNSSQVISSGHYEKGYRYNIQGWVYIHIEGEPYERGYQYGYLATAEIIDTIYRWAELAHEADFMNIFIIKKLPKNHDKLSEQFWNICKSNAMNMFLNQIPDEYQQEMKGMVDGIKNRGGKVFGHDVEFEDIITINLLQDSMLTIKHFKYRFHPFRGVFSFSKFGTLFKLLKNAIKSGEFKETQHLGHCSAFIATGSVTEDGGIVIGQSTFFNPAVAQRCNIILDVQPSNGYRFMMTAPPGSLWSQEDFYLNERGIVLTETEYAAKGPWKKGTPKGVRSRRAIQYSDSIDDVIESLQNGNDGIIPNEWLIGDTKTGEIASLEQALFNTPIKRTFDGFYGSYVSPHDPKVKRELYGIISFIPRLSKILYDSFAGGRDKKFEELEKQYNGKIDAEIAKKILGTFPICRGMTDGKITTSKLMENMGLLAFMGNPNGSTFKPTDKHKTQFHSITELPPTGWLEVYPSKSKSDNLPLMNRKYWKEINENSKILWQYETNDITNINYSSSIVSEDIVYTVTSSGIIYALDTSNGKQMWNRNIGDKSVDPVISKDLVFVGSDKGLHAIKKDTGKIKWEKLIGEISSKPIIANDLVIASCSNGNLYTFDIDSGEQKWTHRFDDVAYTSEVQRDKIYIGSGDTCYAFDIADRELIWKYETDGEITASPRISDSTVYVGSWDGNIYALDSNTGKAKWSYETGWGIDSTPDVSDGMVFVGSLDNNFYALDANNGELKWYFTCKSAIHSSPVTYGEYVFFGCDDGRFYALNKEEGDLAWHFTPGYSINDDANNYITTPLLSNPVVEDNVVYFGAKGNVYALDAQTFETPEEIEKTKDADYDMILIFISLVVVIIVALLLIYLQNRRKEGRKK